MNIKNEIQKTRKHIDKLYDEINYYNKLLDELYDIEEDKREKENIVKNLSYMHAVFKRQMSTRGSIIKPK